MVIAAQMEALVSGSSAIRKLFEEGLNMAKLVGKENVYDFSIGNPASPVPERVKQEIIRLLENEPDAKLHGYMPNAGFPEVRRRVAEHLNKSFNMNYDEGDILMTVGAAGGMNCVFRAMLNPGDEVIVFSPFFGEYRNYTVNYGGKLVVVPPAGDDDFQLKCGAGDCFGAVSRRLARRMVSTSGQSIIIYASDTSGRCMAQLTITVK